MANVLQMRDNRNVMAWGHDQELMAQYAQDCASLEARIGSLGGDKVEGEKKRLKEKLEQRLTKLGEQRQQELYKSRVLVVGSDALSQMILSCLAGIGVGNILFMDNKRISDQDRNDFLCTHEVLHKGQKKVRHIEASLRELNETIEIEARHAKFNEGFVYRFAPEIIIDATNDPISKEAVLRYALSYSVPIISASANGHIGVVTCYWPKNGHIKLRKETPDLKALLHREFAGMVQGGFPSGIIAGIVAEEYRKFKFRYSKNGTDANLPSNERIVYNPYSRTRRGFHYDLKQDRLGFYRDKKALVAGAGALGNFAALELALMGVGRIDVIDMDKAEVTNLSRQILLRGRVGDKKAKIVAERIKEVDPNIDARWIYGKFGQLDMQQDREMVEEIRRVNMECYGVEQPFESYVERFQLSPRETSNGVELITYERLLNGGYDTIFGCFDNKYARIWLNNFAVRHKVPYIDGGTNAQSGQVAVYMPGKTQCVDCQLDLKGFPPGRWSCTDRHDPSTIIPNIIVASEMVAESINVFNPFLNDDPISSIFQYMPSEPVRIYLRPRRGISGNGHGC